ncbi:MAG: RagB/SusD family nutrient uptake outer membrane protein [Gemmatimonadetes bacterium]|nr:RagB/SusD family nutrient uptake outer membrane protein [Gemmatimonadota bacterium]
MVHSDLMRLIEAENLAAQSDFPGAMTILNTLRANVGLAALPAPADAAEMQTYLLSERFAELFMEGQRMLDLYRFDMVDDVFGPLADSERPATGRPVKFSMTDSEATVNANIQNDLTVRCLPTT